jgi:hypothetical protein
MCRPVARKSVLDRLKLAEGAATGSQRTPLQRQQQAREPSDAPLAQEHASSKRSRLMSTVAMAPQRAQNPDLRTSPHQLRQGLRGRGDAAADVSTALPVPADPARRARAERFSAGRSAAAVGDGARGVPLVHKQAQPAQDAEELRSHIRSMKSTLNKRARGGSVVRSTLGSLGRPNCQRYPEAASWGS